MLTVPYKLQHNRPLHTAEGDVCVSWRSLFLTVLHFRAQVCLEDIKTQISHPPAQNKNKNKKRKKEKTKRKKTPSWGLLRKLCAVPFILKLVGK